MFIMIILFEKLFTIIPLYFLLNWIVSVEKYAADSTTSSDSDATVSYKSDSDHEPYFFKDEDSDENSDNHQ